jgi:hypothetical protein
MQTSDVESPIEAVGTIDVMFNPMSPVTWGIVHFDLNVSVYKNVVDALIALKRSFRDSRRAQPHEESGGFSSLFFRGQPDVSFRLLPTRLRGNGPRALLGPKYAPSIAPDTPPDVRAEIKRLQGTWYRKEEGMRSMENLVEYLSAEVVGERDEKEQVAIAAAKERFKEVADWDTFRLQAAVRHYTRVPSPLLDVSEDPEVAAFMATLGYQDDGEERYGMLWAVDIGRLKGLFAHEVVKVPGGEKIILTDQRQLWGDNQRFLDEQNLPPVRIEIVNVELPLPRPTAQKGRFLSIQGAAGQPIPMEAELVWWSMIERWSYGVAFIQTGVVYENLQTGVTKAQLLPDNDPYLALESSA